RAIALETLRHHRLIETYLAEALGYSWHEVHDEAEKLEHVISEAFEDRIAEVLGHPTHDPHGDPIPQRDGSLPESPGRPLGEQALGQAVEVTRVASQDSEVLQYLDKHSLKPGAVVTVVGDEPFNGPLLLECGGKTLALGRDLAQKVHVKVVNGERG
ncbi:MAG: metal-dependent transcriptional regulator, partial [Deinococcota bacterium]|nr:metal-dependent transcriptional regulator [Deinococcota bacterium]